VSSFWVQKLCSTMLIGFMQFLFVEKRKKMRKERNIDEHFMPFLVVKSNIFIHILCRSSWLISYKWNKILKIRNISRHQFCHLVFDAFIYSLVWTIEHRPPESCLCVLVSKFLYGANISDLYSFGQISSEYIFILLLSRISLTGLMGTSVHVIC